ncbi:MAG: type IV pilus assembly protein PilM [Gammaproteobacteria bacterium]|nr:type IV pilus assembly protein PilM [Gammaproteobacteria bacterium]
MRWLKNQAVDNIVGIDISSDTIKLLELNSTTTPISVEHFAIATLPPDAFTKEKITNPAAIITLLKDLWKNLNLETKSIALAIPRSSVIIKNISVDSRLTSSEMESRAWVEASRHFPEMIGEIYLDFSVLGISAQDPTQLDLILVACRKDQINPYVGLLEQSGLDAKVVDVNCYALERALSIMIPPVSTPETVALLNLNLNLSSLIVRKDNDLIYTHDQTYDGKRLMTQIDKYKTTIENAEITFNEAYIALLKESLTSHLRHTMHFFYSSRSNVTIQKIVISGDCAGLPHLAAFIKQETNIEAIIADPFSTMAFASTVDKTELMKNAPALTLACGLALS